MDLYGKYDIDHTCNCHRSRDIRQQILANPSIFGHFAIPDVFDWRLEAHRLPMKTRSLPKVKKHKMTCKSTENEQLLPDNNII